MTEKESIKNHFLFKSYKFWSKDPSVMKQKTSRGFCGKLQKTFRLKEKTKRLTCGLHPSGLNIQTREIGRNGARERLGDRVVPL